MLSVLKSRRNLIILILLAVLILAGDFLIRSSAANSRIETDQYTIFSVKVEKTEQTKCSISEEISEEQVDCLRIHFKDPETNENAFSEVIQQGSEAGGYSDVAPGNQVRISKMESHTGDLYTFTGFDRTLTYYWMVVIFILTVFLIAGAKGVRSIFSLLISILLIAKVIIPLIIKGYDPIYVVLVVGFLMFSVQIYLTNGFNRLSHSSILGAVVGIGASALLANLFSDAAHITGYGDENSGYLALNAANTISVRGVVVSSFILGVLGVIDDATVSQVSVVSELLSNNPAIDRLKLFKSAMKVGASHIGSLMNTLFIAYVASALPLMTLLFIYSPNILEIVNIDLFAEEIVRTLVGSMGLVISIPAATYFATTLLKPKDVKISRHRH